MAEFSVKTDKLTGAAMDLGGVNTSLQDIYTSVYSVKGNLGFKVRSLGGIERALNQAASEISQERMLCVSMKNATTNVSKAYSSAEGRILSNAKEGKKIKEAQSIPVAGVGAALGAGVVVGATAGAAATTKESAVVSKEDKTRKEKFIAGALDYGAYLWQSAKEDFWAFDELDGMSVLSDFKVFEEDAELLLSGIGLGSDFVEVYQEADGDIMEVVIRCTAHAVIDNYIPTFALSWLLNTSFDYIYLNNEDEIKESIDIAVHYNNGQNVGILHP